MKAGDRILFGKYSGAEIKIDGDEYLILKEDEILGSWNRPPSRTRKISTR